MKIFWQESTPQLCNLLRSPAYIPVFIPVEALIWTRSIAIVLLIVAHAMRHMQVEKLPGETHQQQQAPLVISSELLETLRSLLTQTTNNEETNNEQFLLSQGEQGANTAFEDRADEEEEPGANKLERVRSYMAGHPQAKVREVAEALNISISTASKWMNKPPSKSETINCAKYTLLLKLFTNLMVLLYFISKIVIFIYYDFSRTLPFFYGVNHSDKVFIC